MSSAVPEGWRAMHEPVTRCDKPRTDGQRFPGSMRMVVPGVVLLFLFALPAALRAQDITERVVWEGVVCEREREARAYLEVYPTGAYVAEARACLEQQLGLDRAGRILVQQGLASLDYEVGVADGLLGPATRQAIRTWQRAKGFAATGYLTREQADTLERFTMSCSYLAPPWSCRP